MVITTNPNPILTLNGEASYLSITTDSTHFNDIINGLSFGLDDVATSDLAVCIIDIVETHAFVRQDVDWDAVRSHTTSLKAHWEIDGYLQYHLIQSLRIAGDNHSFIRSLEGVGSTGTPAGQDVHIDPPTLPTGKILRGYGYINFPTHNMIGPEYGRQYARRVAEIRNQYVAKGVCGWIFDLREMSGGDVSALLTGLYPFLPDGKLAGNVDAHGAEWWIEKNGQEITPLTHYIETDVDWPEDVDNPSNPIAVLIGSQTGSAGEFALLALMARQNLKTFGHTTAGFITGNSVIPLFYNAGLALETTAALDATGKIYAKWIEPDIWSRSIGFAGNVSDDVLTPVYDWLDSKESHFPHTIT